MHRGILLVSLLSTLSLTLFGLTGCGEKFINIGSLSGTATEKISKSPSNTDASALPKSSLADPSLTWQGSPPEEVRADAIQPVEPIHFNHEASKRANTNTALFTGTPSDMDRGSALGGETDSATLPGKGSDIATQSRSSTTDDKESMPDSAQMAKAEPSDRLREQLDKMKEEELATAAAGLRDVFFPFDSWSFTPEAEESLERTMKWLTTEPASRLVIEGHADQRGTQSYNMVLGKRRAMAIHDYLFRLGVDPSRLSVVSYGKDKPFCLEPTEVCHQLNRRGHLLIQD